MGKIDGETWDPLKYATSPNDLLFEGITQREIRNILKSYVGFYDPFSELIQNAMDAVDKRSKRKDAGKEYQKKLLIRIDLSEDLLSVSDNGCGFTQAEFRHFLSPHVSFKVEGDSRGNKGVGATYLAYGFNHLQIGTKTNDYEAMGLLRDGRKWVEDLSGEVGRPLVIPEPKLHSALENVDSGSTFSIKLIGDNIRPKNLAWNGATTADQWRIILLIMTPLGGLREEQAPGNNIQFDLEVVDKEGKSTTLEDQDAEYLLPHTVISSSVRAGDIVEAQKKLVEKKKDPSKLPAKYRRQRGVYEFYSNDELINSVQARMHEDTDALKDLVRDNGVWAYGYFCYSAPQVLDKFNDETAKLRKGLRILKGGLQLATNGMPQGELLVIPLTSNIGYQNQAHVIVHLSDAEPDLGRKGFQPELREMAERIAVTIVNQLKRWRDNLLRDSGPGQHHEDLLKLEEWIDTQKKNEEERPLKLEHEHFFVPTSVVPITSQPSSEQDVVALFNQLIAGGVIRGIKIMATSSHKQYDGLFKYHVNGAVKNHKFDVKNQLGVEEVAHPLNFESKPYVLEYKYDLDSLVAEFENEEKRQEDIDLAVVWKIGERWKTRFEIVSLLLDDNRHQREFHGVTHRVLDGHTQEHRMDLIVLSDVFEFLNDKEGCIAKQVAEYEAEE